MADDPRSPAELIAQRYIPQLADALQRGTLALFIGADLPEAVTGLPERATLARGLARHHGLAGSDSLAAVAQQVGRHGQRFEIVRYLRDRLDTTGKAPQPFHRRVVDLAEQHHVATLVTTAYDDLLKRAFEERQVGLDVVVRGGDVVFASPRTPTLIKLYGDLGQVDTLVVTEDDHYGLWRERDKEAVLHEVRSALGRNAVLFVGYNLADPDFNLLWREVLDRAGKFAIGAYAAWPGAREALTQVWEDRRVQILDLPALDVLGHLLGDLSGGRREEEREEVEEVETTGRTRSPLPPVDPRPDRLAAVRDLLREAFTTETLRRFCEDRPLFRPILAEFAPGYGLNGMIDEVITYCRTNVLLDALLSEVEAVNPEQYALHRARLGTGAGPVEGEP